MHSTKIAAANKKIAAVWRRVRAAFLASAFLEVFFLEEDLCLAMEDFSFCYVVGAKTPQEMQIYEMCS